MWKLKGNPLNRYITLVVVVAMIIAMVTLTIRFVASNSDWQEKSCVNQTVEEVYALVSQEREQIRGLVQQSYVEDDSTYTISSIEYAYFLQQTGRSDLQPACGEIYVGIDSLGRVVVLGHYPNGGTYTYPPKP